MRKSTSGKVAAFDQGERTVTLEGGTMFHIAPAVDLTAIRAGDFVAVEYDETPLPPAPDAPKGAPARFNNIADVVARSSPNHPMRGPIKSAPTPAPAPVVNTTASLKTKP